MTWNEYYERYGEWAESTAARLISVIRDFGPADEVAEVAQSFMDEKASARLIRRAVQCGVRFPPALILETAASVTEEAVCDMVRTRQGKFTAEEYEELEGCCSDQALLDAVKQADCPDEEEEPLFSSAPSPKQQRPGLFAVFGAHTLIRRLRHPPQHGRCTGDCARCPDHYGYRYGRWYYGKHHTHGCEFGGNDGSGKM